MTVLNLAILFLAISSVVMTLISNIKKKRARNKEAEIVGMEAAECGSTQEPFENPKEQPKKKQPMATPVLGKGRIVRPAHIDNTDWSKFDRPAIFRKLEAEGLDPESEIFAGDADVKPAKKSTPNKPRSANKAGPKRSVSSFSELGELKGELANSEQPTSVRYEAV